MQIAIRSDFFSLIVLLKRSTHHCDSFQLWSELEKKKKKTQHQTKFHNTVWPLNIGHRVQLVSADCGKSMPTCERQPDAIKQTTDICLRWMVTLAECHVYMRVCICVYVCVFFL